MTVIEVIKKFGLEDFSKYYKNANGTPRNVSFPLMELVDLEVKGIDVNFPTNEVTITLKTWE